MQGKKVLFLFLALLLPICVFLFLKIFGKNEFQVKPLFQEVLPELSMECLPVKLPYRLSAAVVAEAQNQITRLKEEFAGAPLTIKIIDADDAFDQAKKCVFFLKDPYDLVLVDNKGLIRGQYVSHDREETDRLITEIDIILKKY
jgi:hypothetical protein